MHGSVLIDIYSTVYLIHLVITYAKILFYSLLNIFKSYDDYIGMLMTVYKKIQVITGYIVLDVLHFIFYLFVLRFTPISEKGLFFLRNIFSIYDSK